MAAKCARARQTTATHVEYDTYLYVAHFEWPFTCTTSNGSAGYGKSKRNVTGTTHNVVGTVNGGRMSEREIDWPVNESEKADVKIAMRCRCRERRRR